MSINGPAKKISFGKTMTKQSFKDSTDINKLLDRAAKGESLAHLQKHGAMYGDFTDIPDLLTAQSRLQAGQAIFQDLPAEVRKEFDQDMGKFFTWVNDPANKDSLAEKIPALAQRGRDLPQPSRVGDAARIANNPEPSGSNPDAESSPASGEPG